MPTWNGRRREVDDQLRAGEREIGRGRTGLPDVLADRDPDGRVPDAQDDELASLGEVAVLVEDAVVREEVLPVDGLHAPIGADRAGVGEIAVEPRRSDERRDAGALRGDLLERLVRGADEPGPEQEVLRWVPGRRELGEDDEIRSGCACLAEAREDLLAVAVEVADDDVQLRERESHGFRLTVTN